jgi:hypothetical protein
MSDHGSLLFDLIPLIKSDGTSTGPHWLFEHAQGCKVLESPTPSPSWGPMAPSSILLVRLKDAMPWRVVPATSP